MARSRENKWLKRFAILTAICTLCLIGVGGLVTSHGVGMAVPDWPTTYGYNMFFFPIDQWVGGIFYEHSHRLVASGVGFLTMILCGWLLIKEERVWLRWLGVVALVAVIVQGVLGGLRVTMYKQEIGIFHGTLAQLFLLLTAAIALFLSPWWQKLPSGLGHRVTLGFRKLVLVSATLVLVQLALGAAMRHQHAGLAVPDFPLAHGQLYPPTDPAFIEKYNQSRIDSRDFSPVTATQIHLHMAHRFLACTILLAVAAVYLAARKISGVAVVRKLAGGWLALILIQASLGAWTVWSNKAADIATAHVVVGACNLIMGGLLYIICARLAWQTQAERVESPRPLPVGSAILTNS